MAKHGIKEIKVTEEEHQLEMLLVENIGLHQQLDRLWKMLLDATPATWLTMKQAIPKPEATDKK